MRLFKKLLPRGIKTWLKEFAVRQSYQGGRRLCPVCQAGLNYFGPMPDYYFRELQEHQYLHSIFAEETLNILGFICPACGAYDRDRLYALHFGRLFSTLDPSRKLRFIDFAPSKFLSPWLRRQPGLDYRSADLNNLEADDRVDITDMKVYPDQSADLFLCSHILEHVPDDRKAMRELRRILRPGGQGIVMCPINLALSEVYENWEITSESGRWHHFGQNDHVRVYSKQGFVSRLEESGFEVAQLGVGHFGAEAFARHGIHPRSVLYVATRSPGAPR